ncbi:MAG TPA: type VI secretion system baseplate subunit TssF [Paenalcaligenes sp.]|nr:type VI secretion system baseplate subunit TssF [Paenalcaligenes sp.]
MRQFLDYYNDELAFMREMGKEFAEQHPKIAARLGMKDIEVADPYIERLLEGFSFLTARIQMKMDAEYPQFTANLLDLLQPNYTAPVPSMTVVQCKPSFNQGSLAKGAVLPRGTVLRGQVPKGEQTAPEFTTAQDVCLTPLQISHLHTGPVATDLKAFAMQHGVRSQQLQRQLTLRFDLQGGVLLKDLQLDQLMLYLQGQNTHMYALLEWLMTQTQAVICHDTESTARWKHFLAPEALQQEGFANDQALLPADPRHFQGHRLLQEYFAFPERFLFLSVKGLQKALSLPPVLQQLSHPKDGQAVPRGFQLSFLLGNSEAELEAVIRKDNFALHCTPVINLFKRQADRVALQSNQHQYHLVVDRTRPLDFEVHSAERIIAYAGQGTHREQAFRPFYQSIASDVGNYGAYFSLQRQDRLHSDHAKQYGTRSAYLGSEVTVQLVDQNHAPFHPKLRHLSATVWCTNRDLPLLMSSGSQQDFVVKNISAPVDGIRMLRAPTSPRPPLARGEYAWRLISQLEQHYAAFDPLNSEQAAEHLQRILTIHANQSDPHLTLQQQGIQRVSSEVMHQRMPLPGPIVYGRGVRISVEVDESVFAGLSPYVLGAVLEQYFSRHVGINLMVQCQLESVQRGLIAQWPVRTGARPQF